MRIIRLRFVERRPAHEASRPIPLPRLMVLAKLIEVDRLIRLIQRIGPIRASIVRQPRCYRDARTSK